MSTCPICGAELVELERWTMTLADFDLQALHTVGRGLTATERHRAEAATGSWRSVYCPDHPEAVGFLAERIW